MTFDTRSFSVRLRAEVLGYAASMKQAASATRGLAVEAQTTATVHKKAMTDIGRGAAVGGLAVLAGLGLATKAAMGWQTAWAGVTKTVNGSTKQMALLEGQLRDLATTLPATSTEIAGVAESAGQLGIARQDIVGFTKTMIDLGVSTNLSADEAATSIAQLMNVMQTAPGDVGRLGATLVALGNDGASTEKQIIEMSQRIAGTGAVVGMTAGQVLALSNAVASMGIEVEAGGSAVSLSLTAMSKAAQSGGTELDAFASTAGMTAQEFSTAFKTAPAEAFAAFTTGLGKVKDEGGNVFAILDKVGLQGIRTSQTMLGLASSGDLLTNSLDLQGKAWSANTALLNEANKRYDTAASRIQVARNQIHDAAIDIGGQLLPAVAGAATEAGHLATSFAGLPGPAQKAVTITAALGGSAALLGGAFLVAAPRIVATREALKTMSATAPKSTAALTAVGSAAVKAGLAVAAISTITSVFAASASDMQFVGDKITAAAGPDKVAQIKALTAEMDRLRDVQHKGLDTNLGFTDIHWTDWSGKASDAGDTADSLADRIKKLKQEIQLAGIQAQAGAGAAVDLGDGLGKVTPEARDATLALNAFTDALSDTTAIDAYTANANLAKSFHDLSESIKTSGRVTNDEKIALGGFASDVKSTASAVLDQTKNQDKANASMNRGRKHFVDLAEQAGYSAREAKNLADKLGLIKSPPPIDLTLNTAPAQAELAAFLAQIHSGGGNIPVGIANPNRPEPPTLKPAGGGAISGPGTWTSDSIPALLSDGEYVVRSAAVARYGTHFFDAANAMRLAAGGPTSHPAAASTAAAVGRIVSHAGDSVAEIKAATAAIDRLTQSYEDQRATVGMTAKEKKRYYAEQRIAAAKERLDAKANTAAARADRKKKAAEDAADRKKQHAQDVADAADTVVRDAQAAIDAAKQVRDSYAKQVSDSITSFGGIGNGINVAAGVGEVTGSQVGATDVLTGGLIARAQQARFAQAQVFVGNLRTLRAAGLNNASLQQILAMGPDGGSGYAAALVADMSVIAGINSTQSGIQGLADSFGADMAGGFYQAGVDSAQGYLNGLAGSSSNIAAAVARMADSLVGGLRTALDAHSPSMRLHREVGVTIPAGILSGMKAGAPVMNDYLNKMIATPSTPRFSDSRVTSSAGGGDATFHLYDSDGVLLGTMRGAAGEVVGQVANSLVYGRV